MLGMRKKVRAESVGYYGDDFHNVYVTVFGSEIGPCYVKWSDMADGSDDIAEVDVDHHSEGKLRVWFYKKDVVCRSFWGQR